MEETIQLMKTGKTSKGERRRKGGRGARVRKRGGEAWAVLRERTVHICMQPSGLLQKAVA